jgi:Domain of unknown function (DUF5666)
MNEDPDNLVDPVVKRPPSRLRTRAGMVTAGVVIGLAAGGAMAASAASSTTGPGGNPAAPGAAAPGGGTAHAKPTAAGTVKSIASGSFTMTTSTTSDEVTVEVDSSTRYVAAGIATPGLSTLKVGTTVMVVGTKTTSTIDANLVGIGKPPKGVPTGQRPSAAPGMGQAPVVAGTVKSIGSTTFTLSTSTGKTYSVDVSGATKYVDTASSSASFADLKVGTAVGVFGTTDGSTVTASSVAIGAPPSGSAPNGAPPAGGPPQGAATDASGPSSSGPAGTSSSSGTA